MAEPLYITTSISYPNGPPPVGHAYEAIATDAVARFQRLIGREIFFLTGTDEHGKMTQAAPDRGITPAALADEGRYARLPASGFTLAAPTPIFPRLEMPADA